MYMIYIMSPFNGPVVPQSGDYPEQHFQGYEWSNLVAACLEIFRQHITAARVTQSVHVDNHKGTDFLISISKGLG